MTEHDDHARRCEAVEWALDQVLSKMVGPGARAHDDQMRAVEALVVERRRVLVVQQTGWGKSAVYFCASAALARLGEGMTIIVSPLLALMRDQVTAARAAGLRAATINSSNHDEWDETVRRAQRGEIDLLLVSPERLANERFLASMLDVLESAGLVVIDEAHCISDWGFDFRPDYQRLSRVIAKSNAVVLATTATANRRVSDDVARQLGDETLVLRGALARSSLVLSVIDGLGLFERYAWVDSAIGRLSGSGIIYVPTVRESERLSEFLTERGHSVAAYSGQTPLDERERIEDALRANELKAVVATSALGMGYDKPDVGFTVHVGSPDSPVAYYQQVGRAGRAIERAEAILLTSESDQRLWEYFATSTIPRRAHVDAVMAVLENGGCSVGEIVERTGIRKGRVESLLKIMAVEGAVDRNGTVWSRGDVPYVYDQAKWDSVTKARRDESRLMERFARGEGCLMAFLQEALDDTQIQECGSCSVCTKRLPYPGRSVDARTVGAVAAFLRGEDNVLEPRKLWPRGAVEGMGGRIVGAEEGRALGYGDDATWRDVRTLLEMSQPEISDDLANGIVRLLGRWKSSWSVRPTSVVVIGSTRPGPARLVEQVARHIATVGHLDVATCVNVSGARGDADVASGARVRDLWERVSVAAERVPQGPVLLLDDTYRSGWTMTVVAAKLRLAGASAVLPLVLMQEP